MKKKLLGLAVASALAIPPAFAQTNVTVYGTLLPLFDRAKSDGATPAGTNPATLATQTQVLQTRPAEPRLGVEQPYRQRLTSGTSNIGFRGTEDLGGGLRAFFQVESGAPVDGQGPNTFASRNSAVGVSHTNWGQVLLGIWDTPYKIGGIVIAPVRGLNTFDNIVWASPGFNVPITTTQSGRTNTKADAAFSRREGNSVQYWTPKWAGFSGRFAYAANEGKSAEGAVPEIDPYLWSVLLQYDIGGLSLRYGYERHNDYFGMQQIGGSLFGANTTSSKDDGHQIVAIWTFGNTRISALYERLNYETDDSLIGAVDEYEKDSWYVLAQQRFGGHQIFAAYGEADNGDCERAGGLACSTQGLGATQYTVGYSYAFSKRTELYLAYYRVHNQRSAQYGLFPNVGTSAPIGITSPGADSVGYGIGILHSF